MSNILKIAGAGGSAAEDTDEYFNQTVLLLHGDGTNGAQNNTFLDSSSNTHTITRNGNVTQGSFSPFGRTSGNLDDVYDPAVNGGSGYFDDNADYLSATVTAPGTGDFTVEAWVWFATLSGNQIIFSFGDYAPAIYYRSASNELAVYHSSAFYLSGFTPTVNTWYHIAFTRSGTDSRLFVNGVQQGATTTYSTNITNTTFRMGYDGADYFGGYLSSVRYVNGTALYTSGFTPSTSPLTAISGTELLCNFTNAGIFDNTGKNNLETVGNAQIDTTTKKYGTGSMEFDGTGDYLKIPASQDFAFGTGDFTFECWINTSNVPSGSSDRIIRIGANAVTGNFQVLITTSEVIRVESGVSTLITGSVDIVDGAWHHIAVTRSGTDLKLFVDGTQDGSTATNSTNLNQTVTQIGYDSTVAGSEYTGFIDDLRITKGVARYTANFTPPTEAFPDL